MFCKKKTPCQLNEKSVKSHGLKNEFGILVKLKNERPKMNLHNEAMH